MRTKLLVVPDNTEKGSTGRLCLETRDVLPIGSTWRTVGHFARDSAIMLIEDPTGHTVTPRGQLWWKNGVRDHGIRENWWVTLVVVYTFPRSAKIVLVTLAETTTEVPPTLPPFQPQLFPGA